MPWARSFCPFRACGQNLRKFSYAYSFIYDFVRFLEILYQLLKVSKRKVVPLQLDFKTALQMGFRSNIKLEYINKKMRTVYEFSVKDRKGKDVSLKEYANEVLLIVNTATKCGFTPQYEELEKLYETYHHRVSRFSTSLATSLDSRRQVLTKAFISSASLHTAQNSSATRRSR